MIQIKMMMKSRLKMFRQAFTEHWSNLPPAPLKPRPYACAVEIRLFTVLLLLLLLLLSYSMYSTSQNVVTLKSGSAVIKV